MLAEGVWGHLTGAAMRGLGLGADATRRCGRSGSRRSGRSSKPLDKVIHTLGWPLRTAAKYQEFGGSWIYPMNREGEKPKVSIGFVVGLDYTDARLSVHDILQEFKLHPMVRKILEGGKRVAWGAKAIPEGGYWAMPKLHAPGMVDRAATAAAWSTCRASRASTTRSTPGCSPPRRSTGSSRRARRTSRPTRTRSHESEIGKELYESRNMKQPFAKGLIVGGAITNAMVVTKGRFPGGHWATHRDADGPVSRRHRDKRYPKPDGKYTFDKLSARLHHRQRDPRRRAEPHPRSQKRVPREVAEAWAWMCPAGVYEIPEDAPEEGTST